MRDATRRSPAPGRIDRRQLLLSAVAPLLWSRCSPAPQPIDVAVVGAGLTGMALAHALQQRGVRAVLLEASGRVGGRVWTLRDGLTPGLHAEAGAERVPTAHRRVRALLNAHRIATLGTPASTVLCEFAGDTHRIGAGAPVPEPLLAGLTDRERSAAPFYLHHLFLGGDVEAPAADDPRTALDWLRNHGLSNRGARLLRAFCYHPVEQMSAVALHEAVRRERETADAEWVEGGCDRLSAGLADRLRTPPVFGATVHAVRQTPDQVELEIQGAPAVHARLCALCLPVPVLRRLTWAPTDRARVTAVLSGLTDVQEVKLHCETSASDDATVYRSGPPHHATWAMPQTVDGRRVRSAMGFGVDAGALRDARPFAGAADVFGHDFGNDARCGAAYVAATPGARRPTQPLRQGRVVIAGADLSEYPGWMEGALASAEATDAMLAALGDGRPG